MGNGFNLAHKLETSYKDFIDNFWKTRIAKIISNYNIWDYEDRFIKFTKSNSNMNEAHLDIFSILPQNPKITAHQQK